MPFELTVIDQSDGALTGEALTSFAGDRRMTVLKSTRVGLSRARNIGWRKTSAELLAFTDDDCEICPGWLEGLATALAHDERVGVVFGAVRAADYDRSSGFVMAYTPQRFRVVRNIREKARVEGVGACMAIRRSLLNALGGFDEELGAGAQLYSAEDTDIAVRALLAGFTFVKLPMPPYIITGFAAGMSETAWFTATWLDSVLRTRRCFAWVNGRLFDRSPHWPGAGWPSIRSWT